MKGSEWRQPRFFALLAGLSAAWLSVAVVYSSIIRATLSTMEGIAPLGSATSGELFSGVTVRRFPPGNVMFAEPAPSLLAGNRSQRRCSCTTWSVVTTIFQPSDAIRRQADLGPDWCLVVVGDRKSPPVYNVTGASQVVYLDADAQQVEFGARFPELMAALPWNHFGRKNVGYLYAVEQGAEFIWDFDDDNMLKAGVRIPTPSDGDQVAVAIPIGHRFPTYNPYVKLGAPHRPIWPRGLPLPHIKQDASWETELVHDAVNGDRIGLIQSLADHDPDLDAIYRLTQPLPFDFVASDPRPIMLPPGVLAPLNAQACLFRKPAFWMLLLPISVHGRVSDIWRGYAGQRLMWDAGLALTFAPPLVDQYRNPHAYLADLDSEIPLYLRAGVLVDLLRQWKGTATTMAGRIEQLSIELYERGYVKIEDVRLQQHWIAALYAIGFRFPEVAPA